MSSRADAAAAANLDQRDVRALTEHLHAFPDHGLVEGAPGLWIVFSEDGEGEYVVDARHGRCECDDMRYNRPAGGCKHVRRVKFRTGARTIPDVVQRRALDDRLRE